MEPQERTTPIRYNESLAVLDSQTPKRPRMETPIIKKRRALFGKSPRQNRTSVAASLSTANRGKKSPKWTHKEKSSFVEFLALHPRERGIWPALAASHPYWQEAAEYVSNKSKTPVRKGSAMRNICTKEFVKFNSFEEAEEKFGVDYYGSSTGESPKNSRTKAPILLDKDSILESLQSLQLNEVLKILDSVFLHVARKNGLGLESRKFISTSYKAMAILKRKGKPNIVASLAEVISAEKIPMHRMPWGLLEYQIEFFKSNHINQIKIPEDLLKWTESVCSQGVGSTVLLKLLRGPMWSGIDIQDRGKTAKTKALESLPTDGYFWVKLDGTDIKPSVLESIKGVWSGDVDMGDGKLQALQTDYKKRINQMKSVKEPSQIVTVIKSLKDDLIFLEGGLVEAADLYRRKLDKKSTSGEALKEIAWTHLEYQELLRQANSLFVDLESLLHQHPDTLFSYLRENNHQYRDYLKQLYKKKRTAATHVLVIMVSNEKRQKKPYSIPVQYLPYTSIHDQYLRDVLVSIKRTMVDLGLKVQGVVTDGEFHTLRTRGDTRCLHLWQLIHDAKDAVRRLNQNTMENMLMPVGIDPDSGLLTPAVQNGIVPQTILQQILRLCQEGNTFQGAIHILRGQLVPQGYVSHSFRENVPENLVEKLRSILATYYFRQAIQDLLDQGVDFRTYLYNPEVDPTTGNIIHERSDHNHLLKRIATSTREGKYQALDLEAFDRALTDKDSGLTHAALVGLRKQSVPDAERLLSFRMEEYMTRNGHKEEALYIQHVAKWHEASDGRGLSQLERCKANYLMLNYILDEWMPWHRDTYDFSTIDINKPTNCIRGLTYQTLIEVTANIESQELRRTENNIRGYAEHPRAGTTDDNECFFSLARRELGGTFTLKNFSAAFPRIVREFVRKTDDELPFYYFTLNERYHLEEPNFDFRETDNREHDYIERSDAPRLHKAVRNSREDSAIITTGRCFLPARHKPHIRQRLFRPDVGLPPVPDYLLP